jgi:hypothetical protein
MALEFQLGVNKTFYAEKNIDLNEEIWHCCTYQFLVISDCNSVFNPHTFSFSVSDNCIRDAPRLGERWMNDICATPHSFVNTQLQNVQSAVGPALYRRLTNGKHHS